MSINLHNYEEYFLDHREGRLSPQQERELERFLDAHPALRPLLEDFDGITLVAEEQMKYPEKARLKKNIRRVSSIHENNYGDWMISSVEGLLGPEQEAELETFLGLNPSLRYDMEKFRQTRLVADEQVRFPHPGRLRKRAILLNFPRIAWGASAAAAVILLLIGIRFFNTPENIPVVPADAIANIEIPAPALVPEQSTRETTPDVPARVIPQGTRHSPVSSHAVAEVERMPSFRLDKTAVSGISTAEEEPGPALALENRDAVDASAFTKDQKPAVVRVLGALLANAGDNLRENVRFNEIRRPGLNVWSVASAGVKGFSTMTDREVALYVDRDDRGRVTSYALVEEDRLIMTRDLNKN